MLQLIFLNITKVIVRNLTMKGIGVIIIEMVSSLFVILTAYNKQGSQV
mgnify:CR=1 FL=1